MSLLPWRWRSYLAFPILAVLLIVPGDAAEPVETPAIPGEALVLPPVGRGGRIAIPADPLFARIVAGKWAAPKADDTIQGADGGERKWEAVTVKDGALSHRSLVGGRAYFSVNAPAEQVMILEAAGHTMVQVNGEPRVGDMYQIGFVRIPVLLHKGANELLFTVGRGSLRAKLTPPKHSAMLDLGDVTAPDLPLGKEVDIDAAVVVLNASKDAIDSLAIEARLGDDKPVRTPVPSLVPLATRKVGFRVQGGAPAEAGPVPVELRLVRRDGDGWQEVDTARLTLQAAKPEQTQRRTFRSAIDGSVQYYAVVPARMPKDATGKPGLVLTLHGAAVEATGQAASYGAKPWTHIVAPTNRRPYGFDWEDWGRLDALEVLDVARKDLDTDPARTWLTGHSMGGHGTWHLGVTYPDRFAAIGPSAGWVSMWSYAGMPRAVSAVAEQELVLRASGPSDTVALSRNLGMTGVYVLHGEADDNVPVDQARTMRKVLGEFHRDFAYFEEPGAGHWWGKAGVSGAACVDWPQMFEFFQKHTLPERGAVREVEFRTASPGVSAWCHWAGIEAQVHPLHVSTVKLKQDTGKRRFTGTTENVARLALDVGHLKPGDPVDVELDGQKLGDVTWPSKGTRLWLVREKEKWTVAGAPAAGVKGPERYGPFREAFRNRMVFIHGTRGTAAENGWSLAKARYDAEQFWYRGNGSVDVIADTAFDANADRERNVILYGHTESNGAWKPLLGEGPIQVRRGVVRVGEREEKGEDVGCLFVHPRPGSERALVAAVSGSGMAGMRLTERLPYFVSGVGYPDWLVLGPESLTDGLKGVRGAGYFGTDWKLETGDSAWRK